MMKSQMSLAMQDRLSALEGSEIKFPLLAFTGNLFIADLGQKYLLEFLQPVLSVWILKITLLQPV